MVETAVCLLEFYNKFVMRQKRLTDNKCLYTEQASVV